jgi:hypothetical protein
MPNIFDRPNLTVEEANQVTKMANIIVNGKGRAAISGTLVLMMAENMRLTKEVNLHREKLGYELLPVHEPKI